MDHAGHAKSPQMEECIRLCLECHRICLETVSHCLELGGAHAAPEHIKRLLACAAICLTSADLMLLGNEFSARECAVCAEVCSACAASCEKFGDDPMMKRCAEICRRCAESSQQMAGAAAR